MLLLVCRSNKKLSESRIPPLVFEKAALAYHTARTTAPILAYYIHFLHGPIYALSLRLFYSLLSNNATKTGQARYARDIRAT
jgi:hypothetical protein